MVELGEAPPQEKSPSSVARRYAFALPNAAPETQAKLDDLNLVVSGINAFHSWGKAHEADHPADPRSWFQKILNESESKHAVLNAMRDLRFFSDESGQDRETLRQTIQQAIPANLPTPTTITMENPEQIEVLQKKLSIIIHDFANSFSMIKGFSALAVDAHNSHESDFDYEGFQKRVLNFYANMSKTIENGNDVLGDTYPKELLTAKDLYGELGRHFFSLPTAIPTTLPENPPAIPGTVQWSRVWLTTLADNIIQNTERYGATDKNGEPLKNPTLDVSFQLSDDKKHLDILFDDAGTGFPQDIIQHGFTPGRKSGKGQGVGMLSHTSILDEKYGGKLIPTNRVDANGAILGGRLIVRLPLLH